MRIEFFMHFTLINICHQIKMFENYSQIYNKIHDFILNEILNKNKSSRMEAWTT